MVLENEHYMITSKVDDRHISRHPIENRSALPKPVFALHEGIHERMKWIVEKSGEGYKLKNETAPTGVWEDKVFAFIIKAIGGPPEEWVITAQPQHGDNVYTIEKADRNAGWVVGEEDNGRGYPIEVKPLIVHPSFPPKYPDTELFAFVRIDKED